MQNYVYLDNRVLIINCELSGNLDLHIIAYKIDIIPHPLIKTAIPRIENNINCDNL